MIAISTYKNKSSTLHTYDGNGIIEDIQDVQQIIKIQKRHFKKGEFFMVHENLPELILTRKYNGTTQRVLMYLLKQLDYNNRIKTFRQLDLAKALDTSQPNISKALKVLENDKVIVKKELDYYFNTALVKGAGDE